MSRYLSLPSPHPSKERRSIGKLEEKSIYRGGIKHLGSSNNNNNNNNNNNKQ
jgi:hypothetical protein